MTTKTRAIISAIVTTTRGKATVDQSKVGGSVVLAVAVGFWVGWVVWVVAGVGDGWVEVVGVFVGATVEVGAVVVEGGIVGVGVGGAGVGVGNGGGVPVGEPIVINGVGE